MNPPYIATHSGLHFNLDDPQFSLIDIAHGLSMRCRWNGQCKVFYTTAQHAVLVAEIMQKLDLGDPFEGLHHDDTDAYLPDMPTPWKRILPDFKAMEKGLEIKVRRHFGLCDQITEGCKLADHIALVVEARSLFDISFDDHWGAVLFDDAREHAAKWPDVQHFLSPLGARTSYLFTHDKLLRKRK